MLRGPRQAEAPPSVRVSKLVPGSFILVDEATNATVARLGESSGEIGKVVDVINRIAEQYDRYGSLSNSLLYASCTPGTWEFRSVETLLKGKEIPLPRAQSFTDKDGITRHHIRVRWWDRGATNYRDAFLGTESMTTAIPDDDIEGDHLVEYSHDDVPVFMGHYWLTGKPAPLAPNIACLDYSVAKPGGKLVAYRWDGERALAPEKFVAETAVEYALTETL